MRSDARFRFLYDGFGDFVIIDERLIIGRRPGRQLVKLFFDLRKGLVDLFKEFDLPFHGFQLCEHVVFQNTGQRFINHLILLIPVFEFTHHRLRGLRVGFHRGLRFFLNGLIQRTGLQRVVFELVHQLFFHFLQIVRQAVVQSLDHKGRFISPRRYVRISMRRSLLLVVVAVIRHITPQFVLFACKKSDKPYIATILHHFRKKVNTLSENFFVFFAFFSDSRF